MTDVYGGHNLSLTAGGDLTLRSFYGVMPSLEIRGTYPVNSGTIAGEKAIWRAEARASGRTSALLWGFSGGPRRDRLPERRIQDADTALYFHQLRRFFSGIGVDYDISQPPRLKG